MRAALERHPRVRGAAVVGVDDRRLGAVPMAAVELRPGREPVTADDLAAHASAVLTRYEIPAEIRIVDALPRTDSQKVDLGAVRALFEPTGGTGAAPAPAGRGRADDGPAAPPSRRGLPRRAAGLVGRRRPRPRRAAAGRRLARPARLRHRVAAPAPRRRLRRAQLAHGLRRSRAAGVAADRLLRGVRPRRRPSRRRELRGADARGADAHRRGHRRAAGPAPPARPHRRVRVVPRVLGARGRIRPGVVAHPRRPPGRRVRRDRPEDLEHPGPRGRLVRAPRAHEPRRAQAPRHHLAHPRHAPARGGGPAHAHHRRRGPLLRAVPRRRPGARRDRVGAEDDGWRVANVTLRFERGTAFAQHIITMRSQLRRLVALARSRRARWRHRVGRPDAAPHRRPARRPRRRAAGG